MKKLFKSDRLPVNDIDTLSISLASSLYYLRYCKTLWIYLRSVRSDSHLKLFTMREIFSLTGVKVAAPVEGKFSPSYNEGFSYFCSSCFNQYNNDKTEGATIWKSLIVWQQVGIWCKIFTQNKLLLGANLPELVLKKIVFKTLWLFDFFIINFLDVLLFPSENCDVYKLVNVSKYYNEKNNRLVNAFIIRFWNTTLSG